MKLIFLLFLMLVLQACKHPLAIIGEGDIVDLNGSDFGCTLEQFQAQDIACTENEVLGDYDVNYQGVARPGWHFVRWEGPCAPNSVAPNCKLETSALGVAWWDATFPGVPAGTTTAVFERDNATGLTEDDVEDMLLLNQLYFLYEDRIGDEVWVLGYYGNTENSGDDLAHLVDNPLRLLVDEEFPHHSFARLDGDLPPSDWQGQQIRVYGEIKSFDATYGQDSGAPIPLITVTRYEHVSTPDADQEWGSLTSFPPEGDPEEAEASSHRPFGAFSSAASQLIPQSEPPATPAETPGIQAQDCDRSVIISGGIDAANNKARYKTNIIAKYNKMIELGFDPGQVEVFYDDGTAVNVQTEPGPPPVTVNITDEKADKTKISEHFAELAMNMPGSCTLTVFVTDHGTGYSADQTYSGARPAFTGEDASASTGMLFDESSFEMNARDKVFQDTSSFVYMGNSYSLRRSVSGNRVFMFRRVGENWVYLGGDANNDGKVDEVEADFDFNGDGNKQAGFGWTAAFITGRLEAAQTKHSNSWDTDKDGTDDVRLRWDGTRYIAERKVGEEWMEMGRDTNGDFRINTTDGGVDWNLDGDKMDKVGFYEGINLWGRGANSVLWDNEFANMLKPLSDKGVHIMIEMVSCFSGGIVPNLRGIAENVYAGSAENTKHYNRVGADNVVFAADELAFLDNLTGIDTDSWNRAATAATAADDALAPRDAMGNVIEKYKNVHIHEQTEYYETDTIFEENDDGSFTVELDLPLSLIDDIYDYEFIYGLQNPRWSSVQLPDGPPMDTEQEDIGGGKRIFSNQPIVDFSQVRIDVEGAEVGDRIRIEFTDIDHQRLGYTWARRGEVTQEEPMVTFDPSPLFCWTHLIGPPQGQAGFSTMTVLWFLQQNNAALMQPLVVTVRVTGPSLDATFEVPLNDLTLLQLAVGIFNFGLHNVEILSVHNADTQVGIAFNSSNGSTTVTGAENQSQCQ